MVLLSEHKVNEMNNLKNRLSEESKMNREAIFKRVRAMLEWKA